MRKECRIVAISLNPKGGGLPDKVFGIRHPVLRAFVRAGLQPKAPILSDSPGVLRDHAISTCPVLAVKLNESGV